MSNDIVKRLRDPSLGSPRWMDTMAEGADCIESQAARIAELEDALRKAKAHFLDNNPIKAFVEVCTALAGSTK